MKAMVWHSRKTERAARRAMFRNNMAYYLLFFMGLMAAFILLHELMRGVFQTVALTGVILSLMAMLATLAVRALLDYQAARDTRASQPAIIEFHFGTKFISRTLLPLAEARPRREAPPEEGRELGKMPYSSIRAVKEDQNYLYLFHSIRQPPLTIGLGTEGIDHIRKILVDKTGCKRIGRI